MFKTFILDADNGQIACTTKDRKVLNIKVQDFKKFIPFQLNDEQAIIDDEDHEDLILKVLGLVQISSLYSIIEDESLEDLILDVLNQLYNDELTRRLFKAKKYNIHYCYKGKRKVASYDNFIDARRQHTKMQSYGDLYSAIFPDFNTELND
jgi:hypothetical protein